MYIFRLTVLHVITCTHYQGRIYFSLEIVIHWRSTATFRVNFLRIFPSG